MPEQDRQLVRVRIGLERGIAGRFARMAEQYGVRESWLLELACWLGLPELEARMEGEISPEHIRRRQLDELVGAGGLTAADSASAAAPAGQQPSAGGASMEAFANARRVAEDRPSYSSNAPRQVDRGTGGGKKGKRH